MMKRKILLFLLMICSITNAQTYLKFINTSKFWHIQYHVTGCGACDLFRIYFISGDTIINNQKYYILKANDLKGWNSSYPGYQIPPFVIKNSYNSSYLREDTIKRQVFYFNLGQRVESLLFNFNAKKGDTIPNFYKDDLGYYVNGYFIVDSISYSTLNNVQIVKKIHSSIGLGKTVNLIEGIGSDRYNYAFDPQGIGNWIIQSVKQNEISIYGSNGFQLATYSDRLKEESLSVFPNPTTGIINIQNIQTKKLKFLLYSSLNQLLLKITLSGEKNLINISHYSSGLYYYQILTEDNKVMKTEKLIKY